MIKLIVIIVLVMIGWNLVKRSLVQYAATKMAQQRHAEFGPAVDTIQCPKCHTYIASGETVCPSCNSPLPRR